MTADTLDRPSGATHRNAHIADAINGVLADSYVVMIKTQAVHWNVTGPLFKAVHDLTEEQYTDLFEAIDVLAERVRALGELAPKSFAQMQETARLSEETETRDATGMVAALATDHSSLADRFRDLADLAGENHDGATEDLANGRMATHEKAAWMLKALIQ